MKATLGIALGTAGFVLTLLAIFRPWPNTPPAREARLSEQDPHAYCGEYGLGTEALRACMLCNIEEGLACVRGGASLIWARCQQSFIKLRGSHKASTSSKKKKTTTKKTTHKKVTSKSSTNRSKAARREGSPSLAISEERRFRVSRPRTS